MPGLSLHEPLDTIRARIQAKEIQINKSKSPCICFYFLCRNEPFQEVTAEKSKKFRLRLNSRGGLCALVARSSPRADWRRRGGSSLAEFLIAEHDSMDFCLIQ